MILKIAIAVAVLLSAPGAIAQPAQSGAVVKARAAITASMRDPKSTQFRDVKQEGTCAGATYVSGWANAKNGFGGYGGFRIFLVRIDVAKAVVMQMGGEAMATSAEFTAAAACNGNGPK